MSTPFEIELFQEAIHELGLSEESFLWIIEEGYSSWEEILEEHQAFDDPSAYLQLGALASACMEEEGSAGEYDAEDLGDDIFFHHGDLYVEGHLSITAGFLVTGDLHVSGSIVDNGPDSLVLVMGDVHLTHLYTNGEFHVQGDLNAGDGIVYAAGNHTTLEAESINARILIEDEHDVIASIDTEYHFDNTIDHYSIAVELEDLLSPDIYNEDGLISPQLMFDMIRSGESIYLEE